MKVHPTGCNRAMAQNLLQINQRRTGLRQLTCESVAQGMQPNTGKSISFKPMRTQLPKMVRLPVSMIFVSGRENERAFSFARLEQGGNVRVNRDEARFTAFSLVDVYLVALYIRPAQTAQIAKSQPSTHGQGNREPNVRRRVGNFKHQQINASVIEPMRDFAPVARELDRDHGVDHYPVFADAERKEGAKGTKVIVDRLWLEGNRNIVPVLGNDAGRYQRQVGGAPDVIACSNRNMFVLLIGSFTASRFDFRQPQLQSRVKRDAFIRAGFNCDNRGVFGGFLLRSKTTGSLPTGFPPSDAVGFRAIYLDDGGHLVVLLAITIFTIPQFYTCVTASCDTRCKPERGETAMISNGFMQLAHSERFELPIASPLAFTSVFGLFSFLPDAKTGVLLPNCDTKCDTGVSS